LFFASRHPVKKTNLFIYLFLLAAVQTASKTLMEAIAEAYEQQWVGSEALYAQSSAVEVLWQDFSHKLGDQVLIPLNTYTAQFPEMKVRPAQSTLIFVSYNQSWLIIVEKNRQTWPQTGGLRQP
jgi:hypothetical protein